MFRFTIFGIPVEVQPFFWISLILIGTDSRADSPEEIFKIVLFVLAGFISILIHELGHALTARSFGASVQITLQAFGGYAAYVGGQTDRLRSFLITAAGPGIQILLGGLALGLWLFLPETVNPLGLHFVKVMMIISLSRASP